MGASEAHALVAFLTAPPDNGVEGWLVGAIKTKVGFKLALLLQYKMFSYDRLL